MSRLLPVLLVSSCLAPRVTVTVGYRHDRGRDARAHRADVVASTALPGALPPRPLPPEPPPRPQRSALPGECRRASLCIWERDAARIAVVELAP